jgi:hypothetical protein
MRATLEQVVDAYDHLPDGTFHPRMAAAIEASKSILRGDDGA